MAELKETMTEKMAALKAEKTILKNKIREMHQARSQMQTNGKKQLNMHKLDMHQKMRKLTDKKEAQKKELMVHWEAMKDAFQEECSQVNRQYHESCYEIKQQFRKMEGMLRKEIQKLDAHRDRTIQLLKAVKEKQKRLKLVQEKAKPTRKYGSARK